MSKGVYINQAYGLTSLGLSSITRDNATFKRSLKCEMVHNCQGIKFRLVPSTLISEWNLICDRSWYTNVLISTQMIGLVNGAFFGGYLSKKLGRKLIIYSSVALSDKTRNKRK